MIVRKISKVVFPFFFFPRNNLFSCCKMIIMLTKILLRHLFVNRSREIECDRVVYCVTNDTKCCARICALLNLSPKDIYLISYLITLEAILRIRIFQIFYKTVVILEFKFISFRLIYKNKMFIFRSKSN